MISNAKRIYHQKQAELQSSIDAANERERMAQNQINEESARIDALAEAKINKTKLDLRQQYSEKARKQTNDYDKRKEQLEKKYRDKLDSLYSLTFGGVIYGLLVTILTAITSARFSADFQEMCKYIGSCFSDLWGNALAFASVIWPLNEMIPFKIFAVIISGLLASLGFIIIFIGELVLLALLIIIIAKFYAPLFTNRLGLIVIMLTFALLVWFADYLNFISLNLFLLFMFILAGFVFLKRLLTPSEDDS